VIKVKGSVTSSHLCRATFEKLPLDNWLPEEELPLPFWF
jgi:hypothetical protein